MEENTQKRLRKCCLISYDKGRLLTGRQTNRLHGLVELLEKDENTATFVWWKFRVWWAIPSVDETFYSKSTGQNGILSHISGIEAVGKYNSDTTL